MTIPAHETGPCLRGIGNLSQAPQYSSQASRQISKITRDNATFKRAREEVWRGLDIDWGYVFSGKRKTK